MIFPLAYCLPSLATCCLRSMLPSICLTLQTGKATQAKLSVRAVRAKALLSHACNALFSASATPFLHEASPCTHYEREARIHEGRLSSKAEAEADNNDGDDDNETKRNETNRSWRWLCLSQRNRRSVHVDVCWRTVALLIACCVCETPQRVS